MPHKTPLHQAHLNSNARMVDFAGWEMPIHYGSQIEEHLSVRNHAGIFDVSHMNVVDMEGKDAKNFLQYMCANDVAKIGPNKALYTCLLNQNGGVIDDLIIYHMAENKYRLVLNASTREKDLKWLTEHAKEFVVNIQPRTDLAIIALQGPKALELIGSPPLKSFHFEISDNVMVARTGYTGEEGVEIILPAENAIECWTELLTSGAKPIGLGARDSLRLEAGLNLYGQEMDETTSPLESNLSWTVAFEPQDRKFIGRESLEKQKQQGVPRKLIGLVLEKNGVLRHGQKIFAGDKEVGVVTSGGFSPVLNCSIAMARVENRDFTDLVVDMRGKRLPVKMAKIPFVKAAHLR